MFHSLAEVSGGEKETRERILEVLPSFSPAKITTFDDNYTVVAEFSFGEGPAVLFRADTDAVATDEFIPVSYASRTGGVAHKCGHDGHTVILLGLAQYFHRYPLKRGTVLLLFQSAEETGKGAKNFLDSRFLESYDIRRVFALHNIPGVKPNAVLCKESAFTCSVIGCEIFLHGKRSHAAQPDKGISPVNAAVEIVQEMQKHNQSDIGKAGFLMTTPIEIRIGEPSYGIAAGEGVLRYTIRTRTNYSLLSFKNDIEKTIGRIVRSTKGLEFAVNWHEYFPSVENDGSAAAEVRSAARKQGLTYLQMETPFLWGEDFGFLTQVYPGAMFGLGAGEECAPLHHREYDFPDTITEAGINLFYTLAKEFLG